MAALQPVEASNREWTEEVDGGGLFWRVEGDWLHVAGVEGSTYAGALHVRLRGRPVEDVVEELRRALRPRGM
jgi:hypothetical protein